MLDNIKKRHEESKVKNTQRKVVMAFAEKMIAKLELKSKQEGRPCLLGSDQYRTGNHQWFLFRRLEQEVKELQRALKSFDLRRLRSKEAVINECCDVANFAAAIVDNME